MKAKDVEETCSTLKSHDRHRWFDRQNVCDDEHLELFQMEVAVWTVRKNFMFSPRGDGVQWKVERYMVLLAQVDVRKRPCLCA